MKLLKIVIYRIILYVRYVGYVFGKGKDNSFVLKVNVLKWVWGKCWIKFKWL